MAKPIIATNVSDIPEISDGCGWIVEPENSRQLAKRIQYVFDYPVEAKEKGKRAREKCKREYSWEMMEKKFDCNFRKIQNELSRDAELDQDIFQLGKAL
jgi:glycosyltransferase involved in cell wall biosynthesis